MLLSFLSNGDRQQHAPQSGEIYGDLKQLNNDMSVKLSAAQKAETDLKANHAELIEAQKELASLTATT